MLSIAALALAAILARSGHVQTFSILLFVALIPSVILHEVSHGFVAKLCGDDTAQRAGRLTLNPFAHVDILGTIIVPFVMAMSGIGAWGWAKPVPVNVARLRHPRNQGVLVSLVGPAVNVALALVAALVYRDFVPVADKFGAFGGILPLSAQPVWVQFVFVLGFENVLLAVFNLIPLPPLDGSVVVERLLPARALPGYYRIRPYTIMIPLALVLLSSFSSGGGLLYHILAPALNWWARVVGL